jgi:vacuolar-type H+-ATPase subunit I/STV1
MAREKDRQKLERLKDEIDALKHEGIDHQHPKFQEWKKEARTTLKAIYGEGSPILMKFEAVGSRRREDRMWEEEHDIRGKGKAAFKMELERARTLLDEALEVSHLLGEDAAGIGEEEFISTVSKGALQDETVPAAKQATPEAPQAMPPEAPPKVSAEQVVEGEREKDIEELLHELEKDKKDLEKVQATLEEALEGISLQSEENRVEDLIQQLEDQIKDPHVEMRKVQKTMEELLRLKGKKALLQRLTQETRDPKVPWGKIRGLMKGVWEIDKKFLIDILPDLLED